MIFLSNIIHTVEVEMLHVAELALDEGAYRWQSAWAEVG
jgi:hypothetical protein